MAAAPRDLAMIDVKNINVLDTNGRALIKDFSFQFLDQRITILVGPNGAGKTTLLRTLLGLRKVDSGTIAVAGQPLNTFSGSDYEQNFCWVPSEQSNSFAYSVAETMSWGLLTKRLSNLQIKQVIDQALDVVGLNRFQTRPMTELSSGEQKRAHIARAIACGAKTIVMDEPFAALDPSMSLRILKWMTLMSKSGQRNFIISMHDLGLALNYGDLVLLLKDGQLLKSGHPEDVFKSPEFSLAFDARMNTIELDGELAHVLTTN